MYDYIYDNIGSIYTTVHPVKICTEQYRLIVNIMEPYDKKAFIL